MREVPATARFVSAEPLLGSLFDGSGRRSPLDLDLIDWLIVGGEGGPDARPLDLACALELAAACDQTSTAFFMKSLERRWALSVARERKGGDFGAFPSKLRRREMPLAIQQRSALVVSRYSC